MRSGFSFGESPDTDAGESPGTGISRFPVRRPAQQRSSRPSGMGGGARSGAVSDVESVSSALDEALEFFRSSRKRLMAVSQNNTIDSSRDEDDASDMSDTQGDSTDHQSSTNNDTTDYDHTGASSYTDGASSALDGDSDTASSVGAMNLGGDFDRKLRKQFSDLFDS